CLGSAPDSALQCDGGGELVFHLDEAAADRRHACGEALDHFGRGRNGISGGESRAGSQCAFTAGVVAVEKVCAGQHSMGVCFHFSPPATFCCGTLSCGILVPLMAKSGQYMPQRSQPLHFSGCTTCGGW